jgi:GNAT superfamily N-acetyltransferase
MMKKIEKVKIFPFSKEHSNNNKIIEAINYLLDIESPGSYKVDSKRMMELVDNPLFDLYLMEIAGEIIGMTSLHYFNSLAKSSAWVEDVVVHPKHQGKGLGKKIMKHVVQQAKKKGVKHLDLTSSPHRKAANNLYKKLKFKPRKTNVSRLKVKK